MTAAAMKKGIKKTASRLLSQSKHEADSADENTSLIN